MPAKILINKGEVYSRLTIVREVAPYVSPRFKKERKFLCKCNCKSKTLVEVKISSLKSGITKSCGCLHSEMMVKTKTKHGLQKHPLYRVFHHMKGRCYNKNDTAYKNYGGRGIKICKEWLKENGVEKFVKWALKNGYKTGLEIDRRNNNGNYCPENCRFVVSKINSNNRRSNIKITYKGQKYSFKQFWENFRNIRINYETARSRYNKGWKAFEAITKPLYVRAKYG